MLILPHERKQKKKDTRASILLVLIWAILALLAVVVMSIKSNAAEHDESMAEIKVVNNYIDWFHRNVPSVRAERAKVYAPIVVKESLQRKIDPLKLACLISLESSWKPSSVGSDKEVGLTQIMPSRWSKKFDLSTSDGQIRAGAARLKLAENKCKKRYGEMGTLTHYASGKCRSKSERTKKKMNYRVKYYRRMVKKFRPQL